MVVLISQILLIALAVSWFVHMMLIEIHGSVYFVESSPLILWSEIVMTVAIVIFAGFVLIMQIRRLGERRQNERVAEVADKKRH